MITIKKIDSLYYLIALLNDLVASSVSVLDLWWQLNLESQKDIDILIIWFNNMLFVPFDKYTYSVESPVEYLTNCDRIYMY